MWLEMEIALLKALELPTPPKTKNWGYIKQWAALTLDSECYFLPDDDRPYYQLAEEGPCIVCPANKKIEMSYDFKGKKVIVAFNGFPWLNRDDFRVVTSMVNAGTNKRLGYAPFKYFPTLERVVKNREAGYVNVVFKGVGLPLWRYLEKNDDLYTTLQGSNLMEKAAISVQ